MSNYKTKTIVIKKIAGVYGGAAPIEASEHIPGTLKNIEEQKSLPIQYEIEGNLIFPIAVGKSVWVDRAKRNGLMSTGKFQTSPVVEITETTFKTQNSVYLYEYK